MEVTGSRYRCQLYAKGFVKVSVMLQDIGAGLARSEHTTVTWWPDWIPSGNCGAMKQKVDRAAQLKGSPLASRWHLRRTKNRPVN